MNTDIDESMRRLTRQDPARDLSPVPPVWAAPSSGTTGGPRAGWRVATFAAVIAVVAVFGSHLVINRWVRTAESALTFQPLATPKSSREVLRNMADRAAARAPLPGAGPVLFHRHRDWIIRAPENPDSREPHLEEMVTEYWRNADGSGRSKSKPVDRDTPLLDKPYSGSPDGSPLSGDGSVEDLRRRLVEATQGWSAGRWFEAAYSWSTELRRPTTAGVYLRELANQSDITVNGMTRDRMGRDVLGVSADYDEPFGRVRQHLFLDPVTGMPVAYESVALVAPVWDYDEVMIGPGDTVHRTLWFDEAFVPDTESTP